VTDPGKAVFLSYASQDADAAGRICEALRAAGIEVWFDQSELRGGDAWDRQIRKQIHDCALFVPVISAHSDARHEGYFRREWRLAVERTGDMAEDVAFLLPVVVDNTPDATARVPDRFREVQWSRLSDGQTTPAFVERVRRLLSPASPSVNSSRASVAPGAAALIRQPFRPSWLSRRSLLVMVAVIIAALAYWDVDRFWISKRQVSPPAPPTAPRAAAPAAFSPPPHSIAVLPFVNMSGDKEQEYFSDGLTEELLNSLAEINELQVAARTSSFYFKGKDVDLGTVAHKLNVGAVLEGSVRRSGHTIRITAQLINAVTGFHLWSKTYDRDLGDVLKLQTEIATAVASALKVTLLGDVAAKVELGGTSNSGAFDAYLRGAKAYSSKHEAKEIPAAIAAYTEAIRLDPHYALAFAARSIALATYTAAEAATKAAMREGFDKAQADARQALALAPDLAWAHLALANVSELGTLDFTQASDAYKRALALAPGNAEVLRLSGKFAAYMGQFDAAVAAARRAVVLDPLARASHSVLGRTLYVAHRYQEAIDALAEVLSLDPDYKDTYAYRGFAYYGAGDLQSARASCETQPDYWGNQYCLAITYDRLGRHADAEAELAKMKAVVGDTASYQYATVYAQWGNRAQALDWLETALRVRDPGLEFLKTDPLLDPLRKEPRFQAIERDLKFPT
jgi:TolB-like protein